jgi:hypothetical protein
MQPPRVAVVILNYNGKKLLQQYLPSVLQHSSGAEIYIADNASSDDSIAFLEKEFPQVKRIRLSKNYGFAQGYNEALKQVEADYFVLLNSDVEVSAGWLEPVISVMTADTNVVACQPKLLAYNHKNEFEYAGACGGYIDKYGYPFCRGRMFDVLEKDKGQYDSLQEVFWATGACMFVRADIFKEMHGFDDTYFAHMEEIDLCWRMKNRGYKIMAVPSSVVYHLGGGTLNKVSARKTFLNFRNNLRMIVKNYPSSNWFGVIFIRLLLDGVAGVKFFLTGKFSHTFAIVKAHWNFYFSLGRLMKVRRELQSHKNYRSHFSEVYQRSIVLDYYLHKKKFFSQLDPKDFSA